MASIVGRQLAVFLGCQDSPRQQLVVDPHRQPREVRREVLTVSIHLIPDAALGVEVREDRRSDTDHDDKRLGELAMTVQSERERRSRESVRPSVTA